MNWNIENRKKFAFIVKNARLRKNYSQAVLSNKLSNILNIKVTQKKICTLEQANIKKYLPYDFIMALKSTLSLTEDQCRYALPPQSIQLEQTPYSKGNYLLYKANSPEIKQYLGEYHCVFRSTVTKSEEFIRGKMNLFSASDLSCNVELVILSKTGKPIKHYNGKFFINTHFDMCYFILMGQGWQEISMMIAPWFKPTMIDNQYITPLVLTTSAGRNKRPTMHRMLISRKRLSEKKLFLAASQLLLNTDYIEIKEDSLLKLKAELESIVKDSSDHDYHILALKFCDYILKEGKRETFIRIPEADILERDLFCGDNDLNNIATALIRTHSNNVFHNKIGKSGQRIFESIVEWEEID